LTVEIYSHFREGGKRNNKYQYFNKYEGKELQRAVTEQIEKEK
jgi:hypothetical protein